MIHPDPIGLPGLVAMGIGLLAFLIALIAARRGRGAEVGATRSRRSVAGIALQGLGIAAVGIGAQRIGLAPLSTAALIEVTIIAALMASAVALFVWASRTMGRNWSLVARTRSDHSLVTTGPFAHVRHPIYVAMFAVLLALAIALGHAAQLIVAVPLFALGTWLRIGEEERLLRAMFGADYDGYARRVRRFLPRRSRPTVPPS